MSQQSSLSDELAQIIVQIKDIESRFVRTRDSLSLVSADESTFHALISDVLSILELSLGKGNSFSHRIVQWINEYRGGLTGGPSLHAVEGARKLIEGAQRQMRRLDANVVSTSVASSATHRTPYVDHTRIAELKALPKGRWDLVRLIRMIEELNDAYERGNFQTVPMLVRAIKDHIPPIFGEDNFASVFNNSVKSTKGNLEHLENSLKHIADGQLHMQIRASEVLPSETQIDFRSDLAVLLGEVVRRLK